MKIDKQIIGQITLYSILGLLLNSLELISIRKICFYPEHGPYYYGFPMIHRTNMTWVNTDSGTIFIIGLIVNGMFWGLILYAFNSLMIKVTSKRIAKFVLSTIAIISMIYSALIHSIFELRINFKHSVEMNYYQQEIECDKTLMMFNFWNDKYQSKTINTDVKN